MSQLLHEHAGQHEQPEVVVSVSVVSLILVLLLSWGQCRELGRRAFDAKIRLGTLYDISIDGRQ